MLLRISDVLLLIHLSRIERLPYDERVTDSTLMPTLTEIALEAGRLLLQERQALGEVRKKSDNSPVTDADIKADSLVRGRLSRAYSGIPIISEEAPVPPYSERKGWREFWLVDALDGTKEFINGLDEYTVNIALIRDGIPVAGIVHGPSKNLVYSGSSDGGSWRWKLEEPAPVRIFSAAPPAGEALDIVESRSHPSAELENYLKQVKVRRRIQSGSSLKFGLLADGTAQLYPRLGPTMEWDVAAGDAVFRYSGRNAPRKSPLRYNQESLKIPSFIVGLD
jgi:3'(2'), 5'-bisphosphate nucleotidase